MPYPYGTSFWSTNYDSRKRKDSIVNHKKIMAAAVSIAALASLAACGGVKDSGSASGDADVITVGTTDKVTSVDPAGSYDNGSYAVQINVFPFLYAQDYNTSELSPDIAADDGTWSDDGTEFTVKIKSGLKFANGHDLTSSTVSTRSTMRMVRVRCWPTSNPSIRQMTPLWCSIPKSRTM